MALPTDHTTICLWRAFVVQRWVKERDIRLACLEARCLGMAMDVEDFKEIIHEYVNQQDETNIIRKSDKM